MSDDGLNPIFIAAHLWQARGWQVVPAQPDSKELVPGFGIYQNKVDSGHNVAFWFQDRRSNLGVIAPRERGELILDFDKLDVYFDFCHRWPYLGSSYMETTPRGGRHIFLRSSTNIPTGLDLVPGIEVLTLAIVFPSRVEGKSYRIGNCGDILTGDVLAALQPYIVPGGISSASKRIVSKVGRPVPKKDLYKASPGIVEGVKQQWPILEYLAYFEPKLILCGSGRWMTGLCPWHEDHRPSLWVDRERNLWGCQACKQHGDVINWHMLHLGTNDLGKAVRDLARYRVKVGA